MPDFSLLPMILLAALVASASPGPATIAIATTAAEHGRRPALALASGILCGSFTWSIAAACGLAAIMVTHGWLVEAIRYAGAGYLAWLAWKSASAAWRNDAAFADSSVTPASLRTFWVRGLLLHLTNPKAIFFFGALYSIALSPGQSSATLVMIVMAVGLQSAAVFLGYAVLFSKAGFRRGYARAARGIRATCAVLFGGFAYKLLTLRLTSA
ncbi:LysE family translocator [Roseovarius sp. EL26]|uniref:LysE family translocator n=1 Tax=Roseovarius sp. EL26 TaxID=2126672 RepID=UPI000EA2F803|nr:LysE family translocator [Roseovarius sp. EL26]